MIWFGMRKILSEKNVKKEGKEVDISEEGEVEKKNFIGGEERVGEGVKEVIGGNEEYEDKMKKRIRDMRKSMSMKEKIRIEKMIEMDEESVDEVIKKWIKEKD